jgi:hypothetical protein
MHQDGAESRRAISWLVVILGILTGTAFLVLVAPMMLFTIGKNDSLPEIVGGAALQLSRPMFQKHNRKKRLRRYGGSDSPQLTICRARGTSVPMTFFPRAEARGFHLASRKARLVQRHGWFLLLLPIVVI